jgi:uncharacterized membrane protein
MIAKPRIDALTDGIFAVAMTLLVLDLRLPEGFSPQTSQEFVDGLLGLWPRFLPYLLSFGVLGLRWLSNATRRAQEEFVSRRYVNWWLLYLLLITCIPFSTVVVGRYDNLAPAVWLYLAHTLLLVLVGVRMETLLPQAQTSERDQDRRINTAVLIASVLLAFAVSFISPRRALLALALNFFAPVVVHLIRPHR